MPRPKSITSSLLVGLLIASECQARDAARDLRRLVGCTIVAAETVETVSESAGAKKVALSNGLVFKVQFLMLDPLPLTEAIIFAKPMPPELVRRHQGKLSDRLLYFYKILIDNEIFDATPQ